MTEKEARKSGVRREQPLVRTYDAKQTIRIDTCKLLQLISASSAAPRLGDRPTHGGQIGMGRSDKGGHESEAGMD